MTIERLQQIIEKTIQEETKSISIDFYRGRISAFKLILSLLVPAEVGEP